MFCILFKVKAKRGKRKKLEEFWKWNCKYSSEKEKKSGTLRFEFYRHFQDDDVFYVYEAYRDKVAFEAHKKNPPYQKWKKHITKKVIIESEFEHLLRVEVESLPSR